MGAMLDTSLPLWVFNTALVLRLHFYWMSLTLTGFCHQALDATTSSLKKAVKRLPESRKIAPRRQNYQQLSGKKWLSEARFSSLTWLVGSCNSSIVVACKVQSTLVHSYIQTRTFPKKWACFGILSEFNITIIITLGQKNNSLTHQLCVDRLAASLVPLVLQWWRSVPRFELLSSVSITSWSREHQMLHRLFSFSFIYLFFLYSLHVKFQFCKRCYCKRGIE